MTANVSTGALAQLFDGVGFKALFDYGCIEIRSGAQPATADAPATGTLLARITKDGGAWNAGNHAYGLKFQRAQRYMMSDSNDLWRMTGMANGTAGWFRLVGNIYDDGAASSDFPRIDGTVGLVGGAGDIQMYMHDTNVTASTNTPFMGWAFTIPPL